MPGGMMTQRSPRNGGMLPRQVSTCSKMRRRTRCQWHRLRVRSGWQKEGEADVLRAELDAELRLATTTGKDDARLAFPPKTLRTKALAVRRKHLLAMRGEGVIGDEAFRRLEEELDLLDLALATQTHN
jgi:hypothetical protein